MSQTHSLPSRACAHVAPLLPLAAHDLLSEQEAARLESHLATCARCRGQLAIDRRVEDVLRRSYAPPQGAKPPFSREEIRTMLTTSDDQDALNPAQAGQETGATPCTPVGETPALQAPPVIPGASARGSRRWLGGLPALAATLVVIVLTVAIFGIPGLFPGLRNTGNQPLDLRGITLTSLSMVSPDEGWAIGNTRAPVTMGSGTIQADGGDPVILHYQQGRWTPQPLPDLKQHFNCGTSTFSCVGIALNSISMISAQEGWAVGNTVPPPNVADAGSAAVLLHYTGGKWVLVNIQASFLTSISMRSATNGWMIGGSTGWTNPAGSGIFHYDGHTWTPVSDPAFAHVQPANVTETADGQVWISGVDYSISVGNGEDGNNPAVLLHYDGKHWSKVDPHIANARLYGFTFISPDEGWAVGMLPNTDQHRPSEIDGLILHYHNGVWQIQQRMSNPFGHPSLAFYSIAMASPEEGWAVGDEGVILHYHNGAWSEFANPTGENLSSVVMVSPVEGWAVGDHGTIVHYHNGSWKVSA